VVDNASGEDEQATEENNIKLARQVIEAFNTRDARNVSQFISPQYFHHESQVDPVRGQNRGPEEFIDTIKNNRIAYPDLYHEEQAIITQGNIVVSVINIQVQTQAISSFSSQQEIESLMKQFIYIILVKMEKY